MKAAVYYENGPPEVLKYEDVPDPQCHPKGIVIRVEAVAIEGGDTLNRFGGALMTNPHVVGYQAAGEVALIQAGESGVGVAAIQLAARAGASMVIATASSDERLERLKPLGMTHGINYKTHDVVEEVMRITNKKGADVVVDSVGGPTLQGSILALAYRGRVSSVGQAGRDRQKMDLSTLMGGNRTISGVFLGAEIATDRVQKNIAKLIDDVAKGELKVLIDREFPLSEAAEAHRYIESRAAVGRVLLIP